MSITVRSPEKVLTPAPEGLHQACCCDIVDLGLVQTPWGEKHQVELRWQLEQVNPDTGKPFELRKRYTASLSEKAKLRQHLETWRGKKFASQELTGFDLDRLIGINCQLQVVHDLGDDGRVWANVQAIVPVSVKLPRIAVSNDYVRQQDRASSRATASPESDRNGSAVDETVPF